MGNTTEKACAFLALGEGEKTGSKQTNDAAAFERCQAGS